MGKPVAGMDGFAWGARRAVLDIGITGFNKCFSVVGDQSHIAELRTRSCSYGVYFEKPNPYLWGDLVFTKPILDSNTIAGIGVAPEASINEITWIGLIVGGAPWASSSTPVRNSILR